MSAPETGKEQAVEVHCDEGVAMPPLADILCNRPL
jgi:hypothetical protein